MTETERLLELHEAYRGVANRPVRLALLRAHLALDQVEVATELLGHAADAAEDAAVSAAIAESLRYLIRRLCFEAGVNPLLRDFQPAEEAP